MNKPMTNKDFWLKLLSQNDTALASVIILAERFNNPELSPNEKECLVNKKEMVI